MFVGLCMPSLGSASIGSSWYERTASLPGLMFLGGDADSFRSQARCIAEGGRHEVRVSEMRLCALKDGLKQNTPEPRLGGVCSHVRAPAGVLYCTVNLRLGCVPPGCHRPVSGTACAEAETEQLGRRLCCCSEMLPRYAGPGPTRNAKERRPAIRRGRRLQMGCGSVGVEYEHCPWLPAAPQRKRHTEAGMPSLAIPRTAGAGTFQAASCSPRAQLGVEAGVLGGG